MARKKIAKHNRQLGCEGVSDLRRLLERKNPSVLTVDGIEEGEDLWEIYMRSKVRCRIPAPNGKQLFNVPTSEDKNWQPRRSSGLVFEVCHRLPSLFIKMTTFASNNEDEEVGVLANVSPTILDGVRIGIDWK